MTDLKVAVIGAGWMGGCHGGAIVDVGDEVAFVVDRQAERADAMATRFRAQPLTDVDDLDPDSFDAAVVTTPTFDHVSTVRRLLDLGVPVLVEKPHRAPDQPAWIARSGDPLCWVGMTTRYHGGISAIRQAVKGGHLGEVLWWSDRIWYHMSNGLPGWYFDRAVAGGGVLTTNGVHALDRATWILGPIDIQSSILRTVFPEHGVEDAASIAGEAGTAAVEISLMWANGPVAPSGTVVVGTRGTAVARTGEDWSIETPAGTQTGEEGDSQEPFRRQWVAFTDALGGSRVDEAPTPQNLEPVLAQIAEIYRERGFIS